MSYDQLKTIPPAAIVQRKRSWHPHSRDATLLRKRYSYGSMYAWAMAPTLTTWISWARPTETAEPA